MKNAYYDRLKFPFTSCAARLLRCYGRGVFSDQEGREWIENQQRSSAVTVSNPAGTRIDNGDMNGDFVPDILLIQGAGSIGLVRSSGDGTYSSVISLPVFGAMHTVRNGDFNGDGVNDIIATGTGTTNILFGNANGSFKAAVSYTSLAQSGGLLTGDFNNDGRLDYIVGQGGAATGIGIYYGNGDGTFQNVRTLTTGAAPSAIKVGDFNNDSVDDLLVTEVGNSAINVFLSNGNGTFKAGNQIALGALVFEATAGDLNGDGRADIVALMNGTNSMLVLMGNGNGTFKAPVSYQLGTGPNSGVLRDINNDGFLDSISTNLSGSSFSVLLGNGDGTFKAQRTYATGASPRGTFGDFNDDGVDDFAVSGTGVLSVFHGNTQKTPYVKPVDLKTVSGARQALKTLTRTLDRISAETGALGAFEQRLRTSLSNLQTARDNYTAASSRIKDADIAHEVATLTKENVRQQVAASILSQANQQPSLALSLLR